MEKTSEISDYNTKAGFERFTMGYTEEFNERVNDIREELLFAIKERIHAITTDDNRKVIEVRDMVIQENGCDSKKLRNAYVLHNIYLDDSDSLCGDLFSEKKNLDDGIIFGKNLDGLSAEDLQMILDRLYSDEWIVAEDDYCDDSQRVIYVSFLKRYVTVPRLFSRGA